MSVLRECRHPLVIFPEGEIYHHHEELDLLNDGVATILLRAAEKLPADKKSYAVPTAIRIAHDPSVEATFSPRLDALERRITWKPRPRIDVVERIYRLGCALLSIKEEEFTGESCRGSLSERIQNLQRRLVEDVEQRRGIRSGAGPFPSRIRALRQIIRKELAADDSGSGSGSGSAPAPARERGETLYDDLDRLFAAQQLYSYPGQYLRSHPTLDRIAETLFKLEEDVFGNGTYPAPRRAEIRFGEPIDVESFLESRRATSKTGVRPVTELLRVQIETLLKH
jgi:1-acyl-sn-glycerol-3-phosphate acyltransferase